MAMQSMSAQCYMPGPGVDVSDPALGVRSYFSEIVRVLASQKDAGTFPLCVFFQLVLWFACTGAVAPQLPFAELNARATLFFHDRTHSIQLLFHICIRPTLQFSLAFLCLVLNSIREYLFRLCTQTTIMAVEYDGGVVMGADSRTSSGSYIANRVSDKITYVHDKVFFLFFSRVSDEIGQDECA